MRVAMMFPVFVIVGGLLTMPFVYGFYDEDPAEPSSSVTVLGVWSVEGESLCRAFRYDRLLPHLDTLRVRLALTSDDLESCRQSFASYDREVGWPRKLEERERSYAGFAFEVDEPPPELGLTVSRYHGDAISATTRYRVGPDGTITDVETSGSGPGSGVIVVVGGMAGGVAWFLWALWAALSWLWGRRSAAAVSTTPRRSSYSRDDSMH